MKWLVLPLIPKFVTPNHVTIFRFLSTPFAIWGLATQQYYWSIPIFLVVAFTDVIDGSLARVRKQITDWGTLYDPVADKLLISLAAVVIISQAVGWWLTTIIIFLEVGIVVGALTRKKEHLQAFGANLWGKSKMFFQTSGVVLLLLSMALASPALLVIGTYVLYAAIFLALMSLITYGL